ncbi:bifunctional diaminohydroxyphosphoribosylaminopyrimidine deaminase/5-amino-6-(5-phosphoribosylamino)uracil reductase RibD [Streptomyces platensis]|uniref:bifunctional diaminohydroxyphosphoribosylaminopyrimidine deaminase/5-amino-6-(5-phosphoribosylamino)uracil reductase RibD n=1 Tax=Streptomyces platensis TaxID=58346 RepID=UPI002E12692B|nr:bifunctional diaminohydroxyphosphoribosylaminopyrimidine deaminase/5-amino-6-(5-phosphoribosylamino)uracil reductase RibD [Streptomyces platensis]WSI53421.1 bifunctional diaminohydroxyphosphoribosylaminopyrimidine deaminase/5-amino-6-(5-phosphoribosylamino)uracil reductase RibD [Streptomyces platensis]WTI56541.1 bifunctional diaminohydroxyphosphoribosylaminopyrimidine deaminase/5-amino-6-(5-phosphoribosylamino)uracil reductase RibD [Streptomyces platensis]WUB77972.1 bifunctional diaminohydrox
MTPDGSEAGRAFSDGERTAMRRAVTLARRGLGTVAPNPVVGAVILDPDGRTAGEGWHRKAGGPHAEVHALRAAGSCAEGGTALVTLEPCSRQGRTGPCTRALLQAGIRRVIYAVSDPTLSGEGATALRRSGVEVRSGLLAEQAAEANHAWLTAVVTRRPHVTLKLATTLDGRIAARDGSSRWITGPRARRDTHRLRARVDAIAVGSSTVLADDPALTARTAAGRPGARQPVRVVFDRRLRTPARSRLASDGAAPTWILTTRPAADHALGSAEPVTIGPGPRYLTEALHALYDRGIRSLLVEGGATLAGALLGEGLVDRVIWYSAPRLLGQDGAPAVRGLEVPSCAGAPGFRVLGVRRVGEDVRTVLEPDPVRGK